MLGGALPLFLLPFFSSAYATNDWSVACRGECSYDIVDPARRANLKISGASSAVSDITPAGGWTILTCDAGLLAQDIRLVCHASACEHLFEGQGAVDTLVRLPETCGSGAFARVAKIQVDSDQSLSNDIKSTVGNVTSTVFILSVDVDFAAVDVSKTGPVSLSIEGYNFPVANFNNSASKRDVLKMLLDHLRLRLDLFPPLDWTEFNSTSTIEPPLNVDQTFPVLMASVDCTGFSASVSASFETKIDATVSVGLVVVGTVIPPTISEFAVFGGLDGDILATLQLLASATGTVSTGELSLYSVALGGIDFPGILSLGPTFTIYGDVEIILDADVSLGVDLAYNIAAKGFYPPETQTSSGSSTAANSTLTLSVLPNVATIGHITASITPQLTLGLTAFTSVTADVSLNLVGSLSADLDLDASANAAVGTSGEEATGSADGCLDIGAALSVNLAADGDLFGLIKNATYPIYSTNWDLYNKCFTATGSTKRTLPVVWTHDSGLGLLCPMSSSATSLEQIIDQIIAAVEGAV
ncbi:hypothetical protein C8F04DRAFT_946032 [Mycena alexandri]|uniref:DUF7223 domain-containing protein n=1 Tax=Mycena alexandri TaxID=1745969 RepID=A0AAD6T9Z4_9AGAR|nr:hypothetical protein C8F04DRAFT_946032 [Mycena alexandri]